jgi:Response regulator containing a CheY-like receiver domain and a GGDEF domain
MEPRRPQALPARPLVLIVDGPDDMSALYALALSAGGFDVVPASVRVIPCSLAIATRPDIIVTDVPHLQSDDWSFVQDLKREPRTRAIPVVILTDSDEPAMRERAAREGCAALFVKPFRLEHLIFGLRELTGRNVSDEHAPVRVRR